MKQLVNVHGSLVIYFLLLSLFILSFLRPFPPFFVSLYVCVFDSLFVCFFVCWLLWGSRLAAFPKDNTSYSEFSMSRQSL